MARLIGKKAMNRVASRHKDARDAVRREAREVENKARNGLARARASTQWSKIHGPSHLTFVSSTAEGGSDVLVHLNAPNAMAIEFGHAPSGFFEGTKTKAPHGLYILANAAGMTGKTFVPRA